MLLRRIILGLLLSLFLYGAAHAQDEEPATLGVILGGAAADYGWESLELPGSGYSETEYQGYRVIFYEGLRSGMGLFFNRIVDELVNRGADYIFVSNDLLDRGNVSLESDDPSVQFIVPATPDDIDRLLETLGDAPSAVTQTSPTTTATPSASNANTVRESADDEFDYTDINPLNVILLILSAYLALNLFGRLLRGDKKA